MLRWKMLAWLLMLVGLGLIGLGAYVEWEIRNKTGWDGFFFRMAHIFYLGDISENRDRAIAMLVGGPLLFIAGFTYWRFLVVWNNRRLAKAENAGVTKTTTKISKVRKKR